MFLNLTQILELFHNCFQLMLQHSCMKKINLLYQFTICRKFYKISNSSNWFLILSSHIYDTNSNTVYSLFLLIFLFLITWGLL